jgi:hypothetical protein
VSAFKDHAADHRFQQMFADADGTEHPVWAEYAVRGHGRIILHARAEKLTLIPHCSYAVAWLKRHPEYEDVLGS